VTSTSGLIATVALLGAGVGLGGCLLLKGWHHQPGPAATSVTAGETAPSGWSIGVWTRRLTRSRRDQKRVLVALAGGVLVGLLTGWVIGALLGAAAIWTLPTVLGPDREQAARVARFEAIAGWAEMLRDTLSAAAGLEQAIIVTAPLAPDAIRAPLERAAARLQRSDRLPAVLRGLADEVADPTADLVISALILAAERRASNLGELLGSLSQAARDHAALRMTIQAARAQTRSEVRITIATTLAFAGGLVVLDRHYVQAYNTAGGQLVLLLVGGLFATGFWALGGIARVAEPTRFLNPAPTDPQPHSTPSIPPPSAMSS
jgi:Flp pilus assembly protein TadB